MPRKDPKAADIVQSHLREHPSDASRTIARYLNGRYQGLWPSEDACLNMVRYYRGAAGDKARKQRKGKEEFPRIPKSAKKRLPTLKLNNPGRWLIVSDFHIPYHDEKAVDSAFRYAIDAGCEHLLVNGDALDAYQVSKWTRDPRLRDVDSECETLKELLHSVSSYFSGHKVFKIGNHEARIESYLFENAPKMIGISKFDLRKELQSNLDIPDWTMIASKQLYTLGKLNGYHGHELPKGLTNPVSVGRGLWNRTRQTGFTSHWHATSNHTETSADKRKTWACFSIGCLCDLQPGYAPVNGWNHGFAIVDIGARGDFSESNHRIVDGQVY